jgi:hypothetical protein
MSSAVCADRGRKDTRMTLFSLRALPLILVLILWQGEIALNQPRLRLPENCIMSQCERSRAGRFLSYVKHSQSGAPQDVLDRSTERKASSGKVQLKGP